MNRTTLAVIAVAALLSGCARSAQLTDAPRHSGPFDFGSEIDELAPGMTLAEVTSLLGQPSIEETEESISSLSLEYTEGRFDGVSVHFRTTDDGQARLGSIVISGDYSRPAESGIALGMSRRAVRAVVGRPLFVATGPNWSWDSYQKDYFDVRAEYGDDARLRRLYLVDRRVG